MTKTRKLKVACLILFVTIWVIATLLPDYTLLFNT